MMRLIRAILFLVGAVLAAPVAYLLLLTGAATAHTLRGNRRRGFSRSHRARTITLKPAEATVPAARDHRTRFLILIPAHNEEALLPATLDSLFRLDYPRELYTVHVVADNCDDRTAELAAAKGVQVHERRDLQARGKGHALRWLLERVWAAGEPHDAIVILDADSVVTPNFLRAMAARLERGERVIQAYYAVRDPQRSWGVGLRYAALTAVHYLRPSGRMALGGSTGLKGNGMVFAADIPRRFRWTNDLAEDVEYHMQLILAGERVTFAPEAVLYAEMPGTLRGAQTQNVRWERGRLEQVRRYVPQLMRAAASAAADDARQSIRARFAPGGDKAEHPERVDGSTSWTDCRQSKDAERPTPARVSMRAHPSTPLRMDPSTALRMDPSTGGEPLSGLSRSPAQDAFIPQTNRPSGFLLFDAAVEQLIPPFSVIVGATLALLPAALLARARRTTVLGVVLLAGEAVYSLAALVLARAPASVYRALLYAPAFIAWKCWLYIRVLLGLDRAGWVRTARQQGDEGNEVPVPTAPLMRDLFSVEVQNERA